MCHWHGQSQRVRNTADPPKRRRSDFGVLLIGLSSYHRLILFLLTRYIQRKLNVKVKIGRLKFFKFFFIQDLYVQLENGTVLVSTSTAPLRSLPPV